jgi:hypothetical protein
MTARRIVVIIGAALFAVSAWLVADKIQSNAQAGENAASSAPQQAAVETAGTRDAGVNGLRLLGALGAVVMVDLAVLAQTGDPSAEDEMDLVESGRRRRCPHCAELIRPVASVCRYCTRDVTPVPEGSTSQ